MTALLLSYVFPPKTGGSGRWFWEVYSRMPREQVVIATDECPRGAAFDAETDLRIYRVPLSLSSWGMASLHGLKGYWRALRAVRRIATREEISRLHCGACLPDGWIGYLAKRFYGLPYIQFMHGEELCYAGASRELGWMCRRVLNNADFIVANSRNTERILREQWGLSPERIEVLNPGVDCARFHPVEHSVEARRRLGWANRRVVLTVGRLQQRKGHDAMIRALSAIHKRVPDVLYSVAGDGDQRGSLENLVSELGLQNHVQFRGETGDRELIDCYQQCDLFVLPNRQIGDDLEGFGIVLLEAQSCGKPVIAGNTGGTVETMSIPKTGLALDCDEVESLSTTVSDLLLDVNRRHRMGIDARQRVTEYFDWPVLTERASDLFFPGRFGIEDKREMADAMR